MPLDELIAHSLVIGGEGFRMLESVRLHAYERLVESGDLAECRERLIGWFTELTEPLLEMAVEPSWWVDLVRREYHNLEHVLRMRPSLMLACALGLADLRLGRRSAGAELLAEAVEQAGQDDDWYTTALAVHASLSGDRDMASRAVDLEQSGGRNDQAVSFLRWRERRVLAMVAQGFTNREIAENLRVSPRTVEASVRTAKLTLGVSSRAQLATLAHDHVAGED